jgi:hypothetical protein
MPFIRRRADREDIFKDFITRHLAKQAREGLFGGHRGTEQNLLKLWKHNLITLCL